MAVALAAAMTETRQAKVRVQRPSGAYCLGVLLFLTLQSYQDRLHGSASTALLRHPDQTTVS